MTLSCFGSIVFSGGDYIYALIFIVISVFISFNVYSYYSMKKKSFLVKSKKKHEIHFISSERKFYCYFNRICIELDHLGNPYGLNGKKYIIIKYFLSIALFIIMYFNSRNLVTSIFLFLSFFFLPNILISVYKKKESILMVEDISNIVQNIILSLSANMNLYHSLKISVSAISYKRLKEEYAKFVENYMLYNFNLYKAISLFSDKFHSFEFNMFLSLLSQGEKEGNMMEILETFSDSLELMYFKNLKYKASRKMLGIILITVVILINSFMIVLYPIMIEITTSFTKLFR